MLEAIFKPQNRHDNGTLVYALQSLDCRHRFKELFMVLFTQGYEAQSGAHTILSEQEFEFSHADLDIIRQMGLHYSQNLAKLPNGDPVEVQNMIQDALEGYLAYLK